ncbi:MAG: MCE family protein [Nocardioides sp.]|nr:MCE family protein [Nocardioides sp.]
MSRTRTDQQLVRFAVIGALVIAVVFATILSWQRLPFVGAGARSYRAEFADASGLVAGEDVRVAGVKVGKVTDVTLGRGKVLVGLSVSGVDVGDRSTARIEIKTLLGQHYVSLDPHGHPLGDGGLIPLARTSTPVDIVPTLDRLGRDTTQLDTAKIAQAFQALSKVLDSSAPELRPTLTSLTRISKAVSTRDGRIRQLFADTRTVSGTVAARDQDLGALLKSSSQVLQMLDERRAVLDQLISGTELLASQVRAIVSENEKLLSSTLTRLDAVLKVLVKDRKQIDEILTDATAYARSFTGVAGTGHYFDSTVAFPQGAALCSQGGTGDLGSLLDGALSQANQAVNRSGHPCLPLGPAVTR